MAVEAPYRRIAAEIRARIASGELAPGDPVPSTRQITREWGVAMATATKVIATLREAGLVETRSGAGTVVRRIDVGALGGQMNVVEAVGAFHGTTPGRVRRTTDVELSRDRVVRSAVAIADAEGLAMLTMRRVAADLGVATMSLYRYVPGKEDLVLAMIDAVLGDDPLPDRPPPHWRARLETAATGMWRVFKAHPWAAEPLSLTRPQLLPNLLPYAEWSLDTLRALGFGVDDMMYIHLALFGHVRSSALSLEAETRAREETGMTNDEWADDQDELTALVDSSSEPHSGLRYVAERGFDYDLDALFEAGLRLLLDGIAAEMARRGVRDGQVDVPVL